jgi:uncharacterized membrane protein YkvA (DUF1232 family)
MTYIWKPLIGLGASLILVWALMLLFLFLLSAKRPPLTEALRLLPDTLRLLRRLAADRSLPNSLRLRLWLLLAYLASPIDLIPDFIPVVGYADDAILICAVLRSVVRRAGREIVRRNWPGSQEGLQTLLQLAGIR